MPAPGSWWRGITVRVLRVWRAKCAPKAGANQLQRRPASPRGGAGREGREWVDRFDWPALQVGDFAGRFGARQFAVPVALPPIRGSFSSPHPEALCTQVEE